MINNNIIDILYKTHNILVPYYRTIIIVTTEEMMMICTSTRTITRTSTTTFTVRYNTAENSNKGKLESAIVRFVSYPILSYQYHTTAQHNCSLL